MKTNLFIAALSLVVLAGCSSEDEVGTLVAKNDNVINFTTYVGKQTKAAVEGTALPAKAEFGVHIILKRRYGMHQQPLPHQTLCIIRK